MPLLRTTRAYAAPLALLVALAGVASWATVLTAALTAAGADSATVAPLLVVVASTLAAATASLTRRREPDLRVARLRGASPLTLVRVAAVPPLLAVATGAVLGTAGAAVTLTRTAATWGVGDRLDGTALAAAVGALAVLGVLVVVPAGLVAVRLPREGGVAPRSEERVRPGGRTATTVVSVALLVAALVVGYAGAQADRTSALVLAGSGVLGLAAGHVGAALARASGAATRRAPARTSTGLLLGLRRASAVRHAATLRAVVVAGVVAATAWSGAAASAGWAEESARLEIGAPVSVTLPGTGALGALRLTERLDPDGRWLMAAAVSDSRTEAELRTAYVDLARWDRVGADGAGAAGALPTADLLAGDPVDLVTGTRVTASADVERRTVVTVDYVGDSGSVETVDLRLTGRGGRISGSTAVTGCAQDCVVVRLESSRRVRLDALAIGDHDLLAAGWVPDGGTAGAPGTGGLDLERATTYVPWPRTATQPVVTAGDPSWPGSGPAAPGVDGDARAVEVVGERGGLPLVVGAGVLGDLRLALAGALPTVPSQRVLVLARADTPDDLLAALAAAGGEEPRRLRDDGRGALGADRAADLSVRRLLALAAALTGLLVLAGAAGAWVRESRRDLLALRLAGMRAGTARLAVLVEAGVVALVATAATAIGGWIAVRTVASAPGLVPGGPTALRPPSLETMPVLLAAVGIGVLLLLSVGVARVRAGLPAGSPGAAPTGAARPVAPAPGSRTGRPTGEPRPTRARGPRRGERSGLAVLTTLLRGLRSRAVLSLGSVLLVALAVGATVVGPVFQAASVRSYTVTRVAGADDVETAVTWRAVQAQGTRPIEELAAAAQAAVADLSPVGYQAPEVSFWAGPFPGLEDPTRTVTLLGRDDVCSVLQVTGRCPESADEVVVSSEVIGAGEIGDRLRLPVVGRMTVVGIYQAPTTSESWLLPTRLASIPPPPLGGTRPARPAPYVVLPSVVGEAPARSQYVLLDSRLRVAPDLGPDELGALVDGVDALAGRDVRLDGGGRLVADTDLTILGAVLVDARAEADAARSAVSPAVISLVLVALAMLLRLLGAMAELRIPELTLASLRGAGRRREWSLGLAEPAILLLVGVPVGLGAGWLVATALARSWLLPGTPVSLPGSSLVGAAVVVLALAATAVLAVRSGMRETLGERLSGVRRPRAGGRLAVVVEVLLVALAVVLPLLRLGSDSSSGLDPAALLLPVVEAVGAGLLATRLAAGVTQWVTRRTTGGPLSIFVALRALARRAEGTLVMLPVTAAVAVSVFATGVSGASADWRESVAATRSPAPVVYTSPLSPDETLGLTRALDPDGRTLLAAAQVTLTSGRAVLIDADRLAAVGIWPDQWLDGADAAEAAALLAPDARPTTITGRRVSLTITNDTDEAATAPVTVQLSYTSAGGEQRTLIGPFGPGTSTARVVLEGCDIGCNLSAIAFGGTIAEPTSLHGRLVVGDLEADGGEPVSLAGWTSADPAATFDGTEGLEVDTGPGTGLVRLDSPALDQPLRAIAGREASDVVTDGPDGPELALRSVTVPVDVTGGAESVPFQGPRGVLFDLQSLTNRVPVTAELAQSYVLVTADAPQSMVEQLAAVGVVASGGYDETLDELDASAYAQAMRLYRAVGAAILLAALGGLVVSFAVQLPERRRDAAALRVVGVRPRVIALATAWEAVVTLGLSAVAGLLAGVLAQQLLLGSLTLGIADDSATPRVLPELDLARLGGFAAAVLAGLLVFTVASSLVVVRRARGASLRETAR